MNTLVRESVAHFVTSNLRTSSDVLGDAIRSSGAQANDDRVYANPFALLCWACPSSHISLLALDATTMFPGSGISEHLCYWYVFSGRTILVGVTNNRHYHQQVLGSSPTYPLELNELDLSDFTA